jgi:hypothetical protein
MIIKVYFPHMDICNQTNCPYYEIDEGCINPSVPSIDDCDILPTLPKVEQMSLNPPMYVRFTYLNEWRHIHAKEVYPVWTEMDFGFAAIAFRKAHESDGALMVFKTTDCIDWDIWGEIPGLK